MHHLYDWIAQGIGLIAMVFNILAYQQKTQRRVIVYQTVGTALFTVNFFMLGAISGGLLNLVGLFRSVVFLNQKKFHADRPVWLVVFTGAYLLSYVFSFTLFHREASLNNLILEFLPVVAMTLLTVSYRLTDAKTIRRFGLICCPCWLAYNIANQAVGAILCEALNLCSILVGMFRLDRRAQAEHDPDWSVQ